MSCQCKVEQKIGRKDNYINYRCVKKLNCHTYKSWNFSNPKSVFSFDEKNSRVNPKLKQSDSKYGI
jgi:hypothetical protein